MLGWKNYPVETIFNKVPNFKEASDPSNIIWENRHIQKREFRYNLLRAFFMILAVLAVFFSSMAYLKSHSMKLTMKYSKVNCDSIESIYSKQKKGSSMQQDAFTEWKLQNREDQREIPAMGYLQCFCEVRMKEGDSPDQLYFASEA